MSNPSPLTQKKYITRINGISRHIMRRIGSAFLGNENIYDIRYCRNSHSWQLLVNDETNKASIERLLKEFPEATIRAVSANYLKAV